MATQLDNFVRVGDPIEATELFFAAAGEACTLNLRRCYLEEERLFLRYASRRVEDLRETIHKSRTDCDGVILSEWIQYTPNEPIPTECDLQRLQYAGFRAETATDELTKAATRWTKLYRRLAANAASPRAAETLDGYRRLLDSWSKHLENAFRQQLCA